MKLIDIGCNLTHDSFSKDRDAVIERAHEAGVVQMVVTGASKDGSSAALKLVKKHPGELFSTAGVHPHRATEFDDETDRFLRKLCQHQGVVAVGEMGLDYFRDFSPRDVQRDVFQQQLQIGIDTGLPVFLHMRDAHEDFHAMLREVRDRLSRVVVHCFTGGKKELDDYLSAGFHIGITGWVCDQRRGQPLRDIVTRVPLSRLLIETDAPYLLPHNAPANEVATRNKRRNEPALLKYVVAQLAQLYGTDELAIVTATSRNATELFDWE